MFNTIAGRRCLYLGPHSAAALSSRIPTFPPNPRCCCCSYPWKWKLPLSISAHHLVSSDLPIGLFGSNPGFLWECLFCCSSVLPANCAPVNYRSDSNGWDSDTVGSGIQIYFSCLSADSSKPKERTEGETAFWIVLSLQIPSLCSNLLYSLENGFQEL